MNVASPTSGRKIPHLHLDHNARLPQRLAAMARYALIAEAELTPKPGLVDGRGYGTHTDLSLDMMRRSSLAIEPYFRWMATVSMGAEAGPALRESLAEIGRNAETAMYAATGGANSHKGAIWCLGLLVSAAAINGDTNADVIAVKAGNIAAYEDRLAPATRVQTHGGKVAQKYGATGARGEAASGFPHVVRNGLPELRYSRMEGMPEDVARLNALLSIMATLEDTCVLHRGGRQAQFAVQSGACAVISSGGCGTRTGRLCLSLLDVRLREMGISPGGSTNLLAATLFLDLVSKQQTE